MYRMRTRYAEIVKVGKDGSRTRQTGSLFPGAPTTRLINCILREKHNVTRCKQHHNISVAREFIFDKCFHRIDRSARIR